MAEGCSKRVADRVAERLFEAGCRYAFGMPGGEVLTVIDALRKAGIAFILAKHENSAGFMAEGVTSMTGAPAVLVATLGPGALNCVNVVANAEQDRVPMIVLTGCLDAVDCLTYTHQALDQQAVFRPITKATFRLSAAGAGTIVDKALAIATEARAGPVHIDVPIGVAAAVRGDAPVRHRPPRVPRVPAQSAELERARSWLRSSRRPLMIAGLDAVAERAAGDIRVFCERFGVPLISTYRGKGLLPETHALSLGGAGLSPLADTTLLPLVRSADLIICAGYDPVEMRVGWRNPWDPAVVRVIEISASPNRHDMHHASIEFVASVGETLTILQAGASPQATWTDGEIARARAELRGAFAADGSWGPGAVIETCRAVMPDNTIATVDSGAHRILLSQMWTCSAPRTLLQSTGLCTMGCALPLAVGARLAAPERPVISFSGDAGMLMVAGELATVAELGQNIIFVVFVDASLALIEMKQRQRQLPSTGVDFARHDFAALGRVFGGKGFTVASRAELEHALEEARASNALTVIAALLEAEAYDGRI